MIRAQIPAELQYRDLAIRLVASACKLVPSAGGGFFNEVISAFGEAFNNVILHGGEPGAPGIEIALDPRADRLVIQLQDHGRSFDPRTAPEPDLESLPEGGMGVFIMRSFMDEISYQAGPPNTLTMTKYLTE